MPPEGGLGGEDGLDELFYLGKVGGFVVTGDLEEAVGVFFFHDLGGLKMEGDVVVGDFKFEHETGYELEGGVAVGVLDADFTGVPNVDYGVTGIGGGVGGFAAGVTGNGAGGVLMKLNVLGGFLVEEEEVTVAFAGDE